MCKVCEKENYQELSQDIGFTELGLWGAFSYGVGAVFAHVKFNKFIEFPSVDIVEETRHSGEKSGLEIEYWESLTSVWQFNSKHLWKYTNNELPNESKEILVIQNLIISR